MDIYRLKHLSPEDLRSALDEADKVEEGRYFKPLVEEELDFYRRKLADHSIQRSSLEHEFDLVKKEYKDKIDPHKQAIAEALEAIRTGQTEQQGRLYLFSDFENKMVHKVDVYGNVIQSRPMLPEERQMTQFTTLRTLKQANDE